MFTEFVLPFEATSVLILMAIVGAMYLARRDSGRDAEPNWKKPSLQMLRGLQPSRIWMRMATPISGPHPQRELIKTIN
jgi:hypothetical protein